MTSRAVRAFAGLGIITILLASCDRSPENTLVCPTVDSQPLSEAVFDQEYTYRVIASGIPRPTFRLAEAPVGMTIDSIDGLISWMPAPDSDPNSAVVVEAANSCGVAEQTFIITVSGLPVSPVITSEPPISATLGQDYVYSVVASGDPVPTFRLSRAPVGMTIDPVSGLISWIPSSSSPFDSRVAVVASNLGGEVSQEFVVQVAGLEIDGWETGSLVGENIDAVEIRAVANDIETGVYPQINSLLIVRNGKLVFEDYFNGANRSSAHNIYSAEKSITSCLMGIAIDRGLIVDENELLYPFFPEYDSFDNWSTWKEQVSLKHLHTMTGGFELEGEDYDLWRYDVGPRDWIKFYLDLPIVSEPGTAIDYRSLYDRLAGHVIERQAGMSLPEFATENLFQPLGMKYYEWSTWDPVASSMISAQLAIRPIDMAKFGQMYMDGGVWAGNRLVSEDWVARSTTAYLGNYGYNWWVYQWATSVGSVDVYYAFGNGGNGIWIFEEFQMIVVMTGDYFVQPDYWQQQQQILKYRIIPAVGN
ncbi:MAG: serine hydrolase [Candidatus Zixiibacteriota bacterium]|nr:MAG: serine hydrolase [candidate division Zixibacteria bacterium]